MPGAPDKCEIRNPRSTNSESRIRNPKGGIQNPGVLTIYLEKPEIRVGKSNGLRHSGWEASEIMGGDLR